MFIKGVKEVSPAATLTGWDWQVGNQCREKRINIGNPTRVIKGKRVRQSQKRGGKAKSRLGLKGKGRTVEGADTNGGNDAEEN